MDIPRNRIKINKDDEYCVVAYGYPNASGNSVPRKNIEDLVQWLVEEHYPITAHYIDKSNDGSQGLAVLVATFDTEKTGGK